jgi:hypothetical protein
MIAWVVAPAATAQHGHPLVGIWLGDWGPTPNDRNPVLLDLSWESTTLSGTINPGYPDEALIHEGRLDSSNWTVHLEADTTDEDGNVIRIVVDGTLENIGSPNRTLSGTWRHGDTQGDFSATRE